MTSARINFRGKRQHHYLRLSMEKRGWNSAKTAEFLGVSVWVFGSMLNLKCRPRISPRLEQGLMELTGKTVDQLWPGATRREKLKKARAARAMRRITPQQLRSKGLLQIPPGPEEILAQREMETAIKKLLCTLPPFEARVIRALRIDGSRHTSVARAEGMTRQGLYGVEWRAMRKLSARRVLD